MKSITKIIILFFISTSAFAGNDEFESKIAGFKLTKPSHWQFVTTKEYFENLKRADFGTKEMNERVRNSNAPLVAIMKYPEPFDDLNPSFKVGIKQIGSFKNQSPKEIMELLISQIKNVYQDFEVKQKPINVKVSGIKSAYARFRYSMIMPDERVLPVVSEMWIIPNGDYFFMIGSGTPEKDKDGARAEVRTILDSIVIE